MFRFINAEPQKGPAQCTPPRRQEAASKHTIAANSISREFLRNRFLVFLLAKFM
jgi:hypothetical protein